MFIRSGCFCILFLFCMISVYGETVRRYNVQKPAQRAEVVTNGIDKPWEAPVPAPGFLPIGLGLVPPIQLPAENWDIIGLRLNIFTGRNNNVAFLDIGTFANFATGEVQGLEISGLWNQVNQDFTGIQISGIGNRVCGDFVGFQVAPAANVNGVGDFTGLEIALVNFNEGGSTTGMQIGLYNQVETMNGVQIGVINVTDNLYGVQIGLCNLIKKSPLPFLPILNFGF